MKQLIWDAVNEAEVIGICGHIRPDGDCVGSCMAMYQYITKVYPDKEVYVYLEYVQDIFMYLKDIDKVITDYRDNNADLFITLDCSDTERLGRGVKLFEKAAKTINIDHHISNLSFADINHYEPESSSTSEVLYELLDEDEIDSYIAASLYTGIAHDTGVFRYSNTSERTMHIAGRLIGKGIGFTDIIDKTFYEKTYTQNVLLGRCLLESRLMFNDKLIMTVATSGIMDEYGAEKSDTEGIVNALLQTKGTEVSVFVYQLSEDEYKVSLRACGDADMCKVASMYGGGGHVKAAGCTIRGSLEEGLKPLLEDLRMEIEKTGQR